MKRLLIIAYYFPPSNASGIHRTLKFIKHLTALGWKIDVLTFGDNSQIAGGQPVMANKVYRAGELDLFSIWDRLKSNLFFEPTSVKRSAPQNTFLEKNRDPVTRNYWQRFKDQLSGLFQTPDNQFGWLLPALLVSRKIKRPDIIYSSAPPFTGHLIGAFLKKRWGVPLVCDFRDPWGNNPFRLPKTGFIHWLDNKLERWVFSLGDSIIANTPLMTDSFKNRFAFARKKIISITNGFDPADFVGLSSCREVSNSKFLLVHPGALYGERNPVKFLFALKQLIFEQGCSNIIVHFIGTCEAFEGKSVGDQVVDLGLQGHVKFIPPVEHGKALQIMKGADILLLFAQGTTLQIPAKLFEYMGIGKPVFAIGEKNSATQIAVNSFNGYYSYVENNQEQIVDRLCQLYQAWKNEKSGRLVMRQSVEKAAKQFNRYNLSQMLHSELLNLLSREDK